MMEMDLLSQEWRALEQIADTRMADERAAFVVWAELMERISENNI